MRKTVEDIAFPTLQGVISGEYLENTETQIDSPWVL